MTPKQAITAAAGGAAFDGVTFRVTTEDPAQNNGRFVFALWAEGPSPPGRALVRLIQYEPGWGYVRLEYHHADGKRTTTWDVVETAGQLAAERGKNVRVFGELFGELMASAETRTTLEHVAGGG